MKKIFTILIFNILATIIFAQDIEILERLQKISADLNIDVNITADTSLIKSKKVRLNSAVAGQHLFLLRAAEYYYNKDYNNANYYIIRVPARFRNPDFTNLKYVILIGSYSKLKNLKQAAKFFYIAERNRFLTPKNLEQVRKYIKENFRRIEFDQAISGYYYFHARQKIIDEINFEW